MISWGFLGRRSDFLFGIISAPFFNGFLGDGFNPYEGIPFIWGFGEAWGMLQGYVGVPLDWLVVGFNPFEKYARQIGSWNPKVRGENNKYLIRHHPAFMDP